MRHYDEIRTLSKLRCNLLCCIFLMMENHSGDRSLPSSLFILSFLLVNLISIPSFTFLLHKSFLFCFLFFFCPDDDCRKTVETSAYLLLSISSGVNDLL